MEISKSLQEEILAVQNKLKNAIRDHQVCVGKLKDDPNNTDILGQIQKIHLHIVSLGRCQKQVVQRLRKEVEAFKTENANGAKLSIASLLGLNNNNHITNNNETKLKGGTNEFNTKPSKEDYEEIVRNGDVPSPTQDTPPAKERPSSVEMISGEDDVIEVSMDENSNEKQEEPEQKGKDETTEKVGFLCNLGLITNSKYTELQNKRAERKRRSTANPQFVYSSLEVPTKRKRHSYLQSGGNAPQTRQTTARMNGPSPPPAKVVPAKSASPPTRTVMKSLIPVQKSTTRPNILRSVVESKVFVSKPKVENGPSQIQLPVPTSKSVQLVGNKAVHIPGLPSSLTIERIGTDSAVCISCRNPGTLTVCENCTSNYHLSCHTISPAPPRICPKCALLGNEEGEDGEEEEEGDRRLVMKKDEELAATAHAPGTIRKAREDAEVYKATCGFHKADATQKKRGLPAALSINQLPSSTFLIPISSNNVPTSSINQPEAGTSTTITGEQRESAAVSYPSLVLNQLPRSSIAYVQTEAQVPYTYQLPASNSQQSEKHQRQSYLIVKKITEPAARRTSESSEGQSNSSVLNYQLPTTSGYKPRISSEISVTSSPVHYGKQLSDDIGRNRKKQANRAVPALNRIVHPESLPVTTEYQLERSNTKNRKSRVRQSRIRFSSDQLRSARATEILLPSHDPDEPDEHLQVTKPSNPEEASIYGGRKYKPGTGGSFHSLFAGHNKSYIVANSARESRNLEPADEDRPTAFRQQQLHHQDYQLESGESNESTVQLQRGALTKFFEHVKLEEAHLPAPPRAKLVHKDGAASERNELGVSEIANESDRGYITGSKAPLSPTGTYEDDDSVESKAKQNSWTSSAIIMNKCQREGSSTKNTEPAESIDSVAMKPDDFIPYEPKHSNAYVRIQCNSEDGTENVMDDAFGPESALLRRSDSFAEVVTENWRERQGSLPQCNAQSNLLELRKEVSVPDDKADTEKQDLSSGRRSSSSTNGSSNASSSNESDTPEQAMHDSIDRSRRRPRSNEYEERLDISAVSPESMQVLEQFESAMLDSDRSNAATC